jgi:hypothetical protein
MEQAIGMGGIGMRRLGLVLTLSVLGVLIAQSPAWAICVVQPFDKVVREAPVIWWGKVVGVQHVHTQGKGTGSWALQVRIEDVLRGPAEAGDVAPARFGSIGYMLLWTRSTAEQYIGQTHLFIGKVSNGLLETTTTGGCIQPPMSEKQQYARALKDLGLHRPVVVTHAESPASNATVWWIVGALGLLVLAAFLVVFRRRWRSSRI